MIWQCWYILNVIVCRKLKLITEISNDEINYGSNEIVAIAIRARWNVHCCTKLHCYNCERFRNHSTTEKYTCSKCIVPFPFVLYCIYILSLKWTALFSISLIPVQFFKGKNNKVTNVSEERSMLKIISNLSNFIKKNTFTFNCRIK